MARSTKQIHHRTSVLPNTGTSNFHGEERSQRFRSASVAQPIAVYRFAPRIYKSCHPIPQKCFWPRPFPPMMHFLLPFGDTLSFPLEKIAPTRRIPLAEASKSLKVVWSAHSIARSPPLRLHDTFPPPPPRLPLPKSLEIPERQACRCRHP